MLYGSSLMDLNREVHVLREIFDKVVSRKYNYVYPHFPTIGERSKG